MCLNGLENVVKDLDIYFIHSLAHSNLLSLENSIRVNGSLVGYFPYSRRARQGDPLYPLLSCIAEKVLSWG